MADITVYNDSGLTIDIVSGPPPEDQTGLVAQLQADKVALTAKLATVKADIDKAETDIG
jgi:capsule polysaccharide export protein KpsE/RkpR